MHFHLTVFISAVACFAMSIAMLRYTSAIARLYVIIFSRWPSWMIQRPGGRPPDYVKLTRESGVFFLVFACVLFVSAFFGETNVTP
jgi:hypothetical protein